MNRIMLIAIALILISNPSFSELTYTGPQLGLYLRKEFNYFYDVKIFNKYTDLRNEQNFCYDSYNLGITYRVHKEVPTFNLLFDLLYSYSHFYNDINSDFSYPEFNKHNVKGTYGIQGTSNQLQLRLIYNKYFFHDFSYFIGTRLITETYGSLSHFIDVRNNRDFILPESEHYKLINRQEAIIRRSRTMFDDFSLAVEAGIGYYINEYHAFKWNMVIMVDLGVNYYFGNFRTSTRSYGTHLGVHFLIGTTPALDDSSSPLSY